MNFRYLLKAALGEEPCDTLFSNATFANLYTMELEKGSIAVKDGIIVGIGKDFEAREVIDCRGRILVPGFIEGHMHVESTFMTPRTLAAEICPLGTTTVMPDPHEIANTCGTEGIRFMQRESEGLPVDFYYGAPSCVPASEFETPFEHIEADEIEVLLRQGVCTHLGEMMNFPGIISGNEKVWAKLDAAKGYILTGHAPNVSGANLSAYLMGKITSDHECSSVEEAMEKMRRGMYIMVRQGATARNLEDLAPILSEHPEYAMRCLAVSDDTSPDYIAERGHMDGALREMIEFGVSPMYALRTLSLTPAEYFRLDDRGAIAPAKAADIVMLDNLRSCKVMKVWKRGKLVAEDGKCLVDISGAVRTELPGYSGNTRTPSAEELAVRADETKPDIHVIGIIPGQVVTRTLVIKPSVEDGMICPDAMRNIAKMVVVEKNRNTGRTAIGFLQGLGLRQGAIAMSVAHDAHNYTCAGMDDVSMAAALRELARIKGGIVLTEGEKVIAELELPVGGLMSLLSAEEIRKKTAELAAARDYLGVENKNVFMNLSFMSLSVIPELKLTDKGYCDISKPGGIIPLFAD